VEVAVLRFLAFVVVVVAFSACGGRVDEPVSDNAPDIEDAGVEVGTCVVRCETAENSERVVMGYWGTKQAPPSTVVDCCECQAIVHAFVDDTCGIRISQDFSCPLYSCGGVG
jgi:hypothetical protein